MRFRWLTKIERIQLKDEQEKEWHKHFAWKPVRIEFPNRVRERNETIGYTYAFLETVWRKRSYGKYYHITKQEYFKEVLKNPNAKKD